MTKQKKDKEAEEFERLISQINLLKSCDRLTQDQKQKRTKYFDVWNNSAIMGVTGSPFDSKEYRGMTDAILSQDEIDNLVKSTNSFPALLDVALNVSAGIDTIRDVPAARQILEYIRSNTKENNFSLYIDATRTLGEDFSSPLSDSNLEYAKKLFNEVFNLCLEKSWDELGINKDLHKMHEFWAVIGLAHCYEMQGLCDLANDTFEKFKNKSMHRTKRIDLAIKFAKLLIRARVVDPSPKTLLALADEFDNLADSARQKSNVKNNPLINKCVGTSEHLRKRTKILEESFFQVE